MANFLVVGGAGYIGSHMVKYLDSKGHNVVTLDNLVLGYKNAVKWGKFIEGSMEDSVLVKKILKEEKIDCVMHFAAYAFVGESVTAPSKYYRNNVAAPVELLDAMVECNVKNFIFSSTCAIFGEPKTIPITEDLPKAPINPYGKTKLMVEQILDDYDTAYGLKSMCLRYFNAAGASPDGEIGENHNPETHLIPLILDAVSGKREDIKVFGSDYDTEDGTCVRDYIHIMDLAQAHLLAYNKLVADKKSSKYNLGNGLGFSVKQVIESVEKVTGKSVKSIYVDRRIGDPPILVGDSTKAIKELGWKPQYADIDIQVEHAWNYYKSKI